MNTVIMILVLASYGTTNTGSSRITVTTAEFGDAAACMTALVQIKNSESFFFRSGYCVNKYTPK